MDALFEKVCKGLQTAVDSDWMWQKADYIAMICKDALALIRQQRERIAELEAAQKWISAKDRLPDAAGYECLVCAVNENYNQTHVFTAHTGYGEPGWWTGNVHYMSGATSPRDNRLHPALKVTHWQPLPEPPKEEQRKEADWG